MIKHLTGNQILLMGVIFTFFLDCAKCHVFKYSLCDIVAKLKTDLKDKCKK